MSIAVGHALIETLEADGRVRPERLSDWLGTSRQQLAAAAGLSRDAVSKTARLQAPATQQRLRDLVEIINRIRGWAGTPEVAFAWYRSEPIPGFGDLTAEDMVRQGRVEAVKRYLSRIAAGGYA
jgi:hypothetical protein